MLNTFVRFCLSYEHFDFIGNHHFFKNCLEVGILYRSKTRNIHKIPNWNSCCPSEIVEKQKILQDFCFFMIFVFFLHFWWTTTPGNWFSNFFKQCSYGNYGTLKSSKCWYFPILGTILGRKNDFEKNIQIFGLLVFAWCCASNLDKKHEKHNKLYWVHVSSLNVILFTRKV